LPNDLLLKFKYSKIVIVKNFSCFVFLIFISNAVLAQKVVVEQFRPQIKDSLLLDSGMEYIEEDDSVGFDETLSVVLKQLRNKKSATSSLMIATIWAAELIDRDRSENAFDLLKEAGSIYKSRHDTMNLAWAFYHKSLAYYHYRKANYKERVAHHQAEIDIVQSMDDQHPLLIEIYSQLMTAHWSARNVKKGFKYYDEVLKLAENGDYDYYRVNAYLNAVNILKFYKPSVAARFADYTRYLAQQIQRPYFHSDPYFFISLGSANTAVNNHHEALDLYLKGLDVFKSSGARNPVFLASLYYYTGVSHKNLVYHDPDTSLTDFHHRQADVWLDSALITVEERIGREHPIYSRVINLKGQNLNNWGKYEEALPINKKVWELVEKQHGRYNKYYSQQAINELARSQLRSGRHANALETYHRQICYFLEVDDTLDYYNVIDVDTALHVDSHEELMRALVGKATALEMLAGDTLDTAMVNLILDLYEQALAVTDARTSTALTDNGLKAVSANFSDLGKRIVNFLCRNDFSNEQVERIYRLVSESKAHALLAGMYRGNAGDQVGGDSALMRVNDLQNRLQRRDASQSGPEYESLMEQLLELQKERFVAGFGKPTKVETIRLPRLANVENRPVDNGVKPGEMVVDYFVTPEFICRFEISEGRIDYHSKLFTSDLEKQTANLYRAVKTGDNRVASGAAGKLYEYLLSGNSLSANKLTIIPDGYLHLVPFEMLEKKEIPLIQSTSVAYRYSSHLYARTGEASNREAHQVVLFAPVFDNNNLAYNSIPADRGWEVADTTVVFRSGDADMLKSIPYSVEELQQIEQLFSSNNRLTRLFKRNRASESVFKEEAGNARLLHIATHGHADMQNPGNSGLFFIPDEKEDGFLFMNEIFDLDLNADLVVLSACKTGAGEIVKGEGIMALPRGFIHAGVNNVVASMWKVHDERTKDLMIAFYRFLLEGNTYHVALRKAKLLCIDKGFLPIDWAGFVIVEG
jgi:CHAT domain-containing protein/tetratricopeptide (TPR) repeat protein